MKIHDLISCRVPFPALLVICFIASPGHSQRKYFEYNNPNAIQLNSDKLKLLIGRKWYANEFVQIMRNDTTKLSELDHLKYNKDGTFTSAYGNGTWEIKYRKYIIKNQKGRSFSSRKTWEGIFCVTNLSDSSLTLEKTLTSSHDMRRIFSFSLKKKGRRSLPSAEFKNRFIDKSKLTYNDIDSLSHLTDEEAFNSDWWFDMKYISVQTRDTAYLIERKPSPEGNRLKIFKTDEYLALPFTLNMERFTPTEQQIRIVDENVTKYLRDNQYYLKLHFESLYRQYVGFRTNDGDPVIFLNVYCWYSPRWQYEIVKSYTDVSCYFNIKYKLGSSECFDFNFYSVEK